MKKLLFIPLLAMLLALPLPVLAAIQDRVPVSSADTALVKTIIPLNEEELWAGPADDSEAPEKESGLTDQTVSNDTADILALLDSVAANCKYSGKSYKESSYEWLIMDMAAYAELPLSDSANFTTEAARQAYIDYAINETAIAADNEKGGVYAKAVLGLRATGIDPADLTTVNKTKLNIINLLKTTTTQSIYNACYMLMAYNQGNYASDALEEQLIDFLLAEQLKSENGSWLDSWSGLSDPDTTAMALQALSVYKDRPGVATAIDNAVTYFRDIQDNSGAIYSIWTQEPSAASTAQVILALVALGIDPDTNKGFIKNDGDKNNSILDGLLRLKNSDNDYFGLDYFGNDDEFSTEQAFCALIAVALQRQLDGAACHPYVFSHMLALPGVATGTGSISEPSPPPSTNSDITVYFTLKGPDSVWINRAAVTVKEGSKVYHVIIKALADNGYKQTGANSGYVRSVTRPNGFTLAEFEQGPNSGWLFKVNDYLPGIGLTSCDVLNRDHVVLYYTEDWTTDPDAGSFSGSPFGQTAAAAADVSVRLQAALGKDGLAVAVLSGIELNDFVAALAKNKAKSGILASVAIDIPDGVTNLTITLPKAALNALKQVSDAALLLQSALGEIMFDALTLTQLIATADKGDLTLVIALAKAGDLPEEYRGIVGERPIYALELKAGGHPISAFKGLADLFLPYTATADEDVNKLTLYRFSTETKAEKLSGASYHSGRQGMVCSVYGFSLFAVSYEETRQLNANFTDVPNSHWAASYIYSLVEQGVIKGKTPVLFGPEDNLTRAELVALLARLGGVEPSQDVSGFADVAKTAWYAQELTWAVKGGVIEGVGDNRFAPLQAVSRQDMAVMMMRFAAYRGLKLPPKEQTRTFSDDADISAYARDAVASLQLAGFVGGYEDGSFKPQGSISRAEAAKLLALLNDMY